MTAWRLAWVWLPMAAWCFTGGAQTADQVLEQWLTAQAGLRAWKAEFIQTRHLAVLTQPLTTPGRVWYSAPDRFRWELGQPARSVALREGNVLTVLSPALKRAERYALDGPSPGSVKEALSLLDTGFPRDSEAFRARFELLGVASTNGVWIFRLRPRNGATRQLMPGLTLEVRTNDLVLAASELQFTDGSRMRNDFTASERDPVLKPDLFRPDLDASWTVTQPAGPR